MSLLHRSDGYQRTRIGRATTQQFPAPAYSDLAWTKAGSDFGSDVVSSEGKLNVQRLPELCFLLNAEVPTSASLIKALQNQGPVPEPGRAEPRGRERQRRRASSPVASSRFRSRRAPAPTSACRRHVQGVRHPPELHADRHRRSCPPQGSGPKSARSTSATRFVLSGFRIPSLSTRRARRPSSSCTSGQTFAIAGLMNNQMQTTMQKIPGIGDIPILGYLFKSKAAQQATRPSSS